jgi:hypothetical protein
MAHRKILVKTFLLVAILGFCVLQATAAAVTGVNIGTGLPPATLGGYTMTPFEPGTIGGENGTALECGGVGCGGVGWATWGQSYTGDVHVCDAAPCVGGTLTLTLSGPVEAVDFYMEPQQFLDFVMTATDSSGVTVSTVINGFHGSSAVGFFENVAGGPYLTSISVSASDPTGFAIGEFGISGGSLRGSVPEGSTIELMGLGLACIGLLRRRFQV